MDALTQPEERENEAPTVLREAPRPSPPDTGNPPGIPESLPGSPGSPIDPQQGEPPGGGTRRRRVWIGLGVVLLLVVAFLVVRGLNRGPSPGERGGGRFGQGFQNAETAIAVSVAKATVGDIAVRIPALGTVTPLATVTVKSEVTGILERVAFKEGQLVHKGELLAQIDPRPYEATLAQAQGNLARDQAFLADAKLDLKRYEDLIKQDAVSGQQLDTQRSTVAQYVGSVEADKGQVNAAAVNLAFTRITAPLTGRVGLRQVDAGNYITPGDANGIVVITQVQPITVIAPVAEDYVPQIERRISQGATLSVTVKDRANSKVLATGKLLTLDNQIDPTTGTVKLRAIFDNKDGALFPNQFVNVELLEDTLHGQLVIPEAAVRRGAPNGVVSTYVYLVKPDSTVTVRPVVLGTLDGDRVAVTSGLVAGDTVVTEGGDRLRDGAQIILPGAQPPQPAARPAGKPGQRANGRRFRRSGFLGGGGRRSGGRPRF
ncbi:MAG: efflux RND transporter periplasmic adaptor subunit [Steroidobacteraceae bacterium]